LEQTRLAAETDIDLAIAAVAAGPARDTKTLLQQLAAHTLTHKQ
jgi:hypothetical protein